MCVCVCVCVCVCESPRPCCYCHCYAFYINKQQSWPCTCLDSFFIFHRWQSALTTWNSLACRNDIFQIRWDDATDLKMSGPVGLAYISINPIPSSYLKKKQTTKQKKADSHLQEQACCCNRQLSSTTVRHAITTKTDTDLTESSSHFVHCHSPDLPWQHSNWSGMFYKQPTGVDHIWSDKSIFF